MLPDGTQSDHVLCDRSGGPMAVLEAKCVSTNPMRCGPRERRINRMRSSNQTPEQAARDKIDRMLFDSGWIVQDKTKIDFSASLGIAVREYQTDVGPVDYVLFVDKKPVGVVEAKPEDWGHKITTVEGQSGAYAAAKLKPIRPISWGRCAAMRWGRGCSAPWPWKWTPSTASSPRFRWCRSQRGRIGNRHGCGVPVLSGEHGRMSHAA